MSFFDQSFRSIWHAITTKDRHSTHDSPFRTGRHVPLNRQSTLTSVATAGESRADITSPYRDETGRLSSALDNGTAYMGHEMPSASGAMSPGGAHSYSPGLRSANAHRSSSKDDGFETVSSPGEIPMQSFADGLPPPPPVTHSWKRIDEWAEEHYPELWDQLGEGATNNDLNDLEHQLDCSLPQDVRDSLMIHDGQERGGRPTGIIFSAMLLDCEEMVQEWEQWRTVNREFLLETTVVKPAVPSKAHNGDSSSNQASSSRSVPASPSSQSSGTWRQDLISKQTSIPAGAVQPAYAHPAWIPLVRDWGGNNLAVDLAPGPAGIWGQIIMFGRDYDTKYVVARSWAAFLSLVADDLNSGKWYVEEDTHDLKLREFKTTRVEPSYFDILRWRMDQKHGRTARATAKRKSMVPGAPGGASSPGGSPYASPTDATMSEARGRSLQRIGSPSPLSSPVRPGYGKSSPLARVTEESGAAGPKLVTAGLKNTKLVEIDTPRSADGSKALPKIPASTESPASEDKGKEPTIAEAAEPVAATNGDKDKADDAAMKTIEI